MNIYEYIYIYIYMYTYIYLLWQRQSRLDVLFPPDVGCQNATHFSKSQFYGDFV